MPLLIIPVDDLIAPRRRVLKAKRKEYATDDFLSNLPVELYDKIAVYLHPRFIQRVRFQNRTLYRSWLFNSPDIARACARNLKVDREQHRRQRHLQIADVGTCGPVYTAAALESDRWIYRRGLGLFCRRIADDGAPCAKHRQCLIDAFALLVTFTQPDGKTLTPLNVSLFANEDVPELLVRLDHPPTLDMILERHRKEGGEIRQRQWTMAMRLAIERGLTEEVRCLVRQAQFIDWEWLDVSMAFDADSSAIGSLGLGAGARPDHGNGFVQNAAFKYAAHRGMLEICQLLWTIDIISDRVSTIPGLGADPLELAAAQGHVGVVSFLLEVGLDPASREQACLTAAAMSGHLEVVGRLLEDPRVDPSAFRYRAMVEAAHAGHREVFELMLRHEMVDPSLQGMMTEKIMTYDDLVRHLVLDNGQTEDN
ncbi:hypothetical protein HK101_004283 [Irineochytrium annulatum]|nr:hypothetical protein HK101_004283 [Irineochytrium annulatum]